MPITDEDRERAVYGRSEITLPGVPFDRIGESEQLRKKLVWYMKKRGIYNGAWTSKSMWQGKEKTDK